MSAMDAPRPLELEKALQQRFFALVQALPVGVIVVDTVGRVAIFNPAAEQIFGTPADRAVGRALIESVRNFELDRRITVARQRGAESETELTHVGTERRLRVRVLPLPAADGTFDAAAIIEDVTPLRDLTAMRRDLVSNISHELRTPLTAIKIMIETLQTGISEEARATFLDNISRETNRMITLVEELLDLARLEGGRLHLAMMPLDIEELCRAAVDTMRARSQQLGIELTLAGPGRPVSIVGDRDKLLQVLLNLLDNAIRNTPSGGRVTVSARPSNGSVELAVEDTGVGIPAYALPHVFERFYVVDSSRARNTSGTGLGLAIVKHIVELHGGTVDAESELNVGSKFRCRFPT